jgi:transcriptional regulator
LHGHIARTNPLVKVAEQNKRDVTAVFHGPNAYITPAWYPSKQETGKVVPTWNYAVVHVQGQLSLMSDPSWIRDHVSQMTNIHEPIYQSNWKLDDAPEEYIQMMLKAIIGIEIEVASLVGKFKLSQNRSPSEYAGVVENLQKSPEENLQALLHLMKKP